MPIRIVAAPVSDQARPIKRACPIRRIRSKGLCRLNLLREKAQHSRTLYFGGYITLRNPSYLDIFVLASICEYFALGARILFHYIIISKSTPGRVEHCHAQGIKDIALESSLK